MSFFTTDSMNLAKMSADNRKKQIRKRTIRRSLLVGANIVALSVALGSASGVVSPSPIEPLDTPTSNTSTSYVRHTLQHEHLFEKPEVELPAVPTPTMQPSTKGQRAAYNQMVGYIAHSPYSRDSLLNMLKPNDQFSEADAVWAIDHSGIDWNAEALAYAQQLIGSAASSQSGLQKELAYLGFTDEQATYAVENIKIDWNEQALRCAWSYYDYDIIKDKKDMERQLIFDGFTRKQAEAAATEVFGK
ncbi:Ltp family lipoprotein [Atopobium sp. oral taxon 810]|uniref:Ltp family lipoprotein n=1 Tax=Atopobium sp. oral taxon 810 TaxID=712158 RepID=UPI000555601C|nr:Ltp family lipoprotein [Atopobium sp. oral taxon 810]